MHERTHGILHVSLTYEESEEKYNSDDLHLLCRQIIMTLAFILSPSTRSFAFILF